MIFQTPAPSEPVFPRVVAAASAAATTPLAAAMAAAAGNKRAPAVARKPASSSDLEACAVSNGIVPTGAPLEQLKAHTLAQMRARLSALCDSLMQGTFAGAEWGCLRVYFVTAHPTQSLKPRWTNFFLPRLARLQRTTAVMREVTLRPLLCV
jgi:hypothetical protein